MHNNIVVDGLNIQYEESGNPKGEPVVLLHGWGCDHTTVRSVANSLIPEMRVINIDLPGHGLSDEPFEVWDSFDFADCINKIIEKLNLDHPSLIGHSFGGRTSIALASTNKNIKKVVLIDSAGIKPRRSLKYYYNIYTYKFIKKSLTFIFGNNKSAPLIEKLVKKRGSSDYASSSAMMRKIMSRCVNQDLQQIMHKISVPVLLIWGENDSATPLHDAIIMKNKIADCGLVAFPSCGHYSFLDNPIGFKAVLREFFKDEIKATK